MRSGVLTGNDTGGAAQVAAAHCPNVQYFIHCKLKAKKVEIPGLR